MMTAIEWFRHNHIQQYGYDDTRAWHNIQDKLNNEARMREKLRGIVKQVVVPLADPPRKIYATVLDSATVDNKLVIEFKTCGQGLASYDKGVHKGVAVQVHKVEAMRNACGRGIWPYEGLAVPFRHAWYVYWDNQGDLYCLTLDEIEKLIRIYQTQKPLPSAHDDGNNLSYSIPSSNWHLLGTMGSRPAKPDDLVSERRRI